MGLEDSALRRRVPSAEHPPCGRAAQAERGPVALGRVGAAGGSLAQRLLEVGDRADDLLERAALAARIGELLASEEAPRLVLMAPAHLPALEQSVVDRRAHAAVIGSFGRDC